MTSAARLVASGQPALRVGTVAALLLSGCGGGAASQRTYTNPSRAMEPTLKVGERVQVDTRAYRNANPKPGEIVVFHPPRGADQAIPVCGVSSEGLGHSQVCGLPTAQQSSNTFIKRVVAGPGDRIQIINGHVIRDGVRENEPYITPCASDPQCRFPKPIVVPPGDYFLLGDNRGESDDSRFWGPVSKAWILGKVLGH
jgi:signal peptidase I